MTAPALEHALGVRARVERRGALAIIHAADATPFSDASHRARVLALARAEGITHLALELDDHADAAPPVPGDQPAGR